MADDLGVAVVAGNDLGEGVDSDGGRAEGVVGIDGGFGGVGGAVGEATAEGRRNQGGNEQREAGSWGAESHVRSVRRGARPGGVDPGDGVL